MSNSELSNFIYYRTYSRWLENEKRRETWGETVERFMRWAFSSEKIKEEIKEEIKEAILSKSIMPSMRALWSAGITAERENVSIYNCSFLPLDCVKAFSEGLYILMQGTGVGFSVESKFVNNLPQVKKYSDNLTNLYVEVKDSTLGWAVALNSCLVHMWQGGEVQLDVSKVRPKGSVLKTKGGRSSGPEPLVGAIEFAKETLNGARGRKLTSLECHDLMCKIAEVVVVGGARRAAMISFSDPEDELIRHAKNWKRGEFPSIRYLSNNSAFYEERPSEEVFWAEWKALAESGSGERGFSIDNWWRYCGSPKGMVRSNPCHEIRLRFELASDPWTGEGGSGQFCNLSAAIMRAEDTVESMCRKIRLATWIGCVQASRTNFKFIRGGWKKLCEEDRLLGVDITGQCDNPKLSTDWVAMKKFNQVALETAKEASEILGINYPSAITCGKPSGNSSQFVDCASGFHPRFSKYYFRHVRISASDPLCKVLQSQNIEMYKENGQEDRLDEDVDTWVVRFPVASPKGCMTREDEDSIQQMERYLGIMRSWCSEKGHNQSATIYVKDGDWDKVGQWLWDHFDEVVGLSFLPYDGGAYRLAPYVEITEEEYNRVMENHISIDFDLLSEFEKSDMGEGSREIACGGGGCEV